MTLGVYSFDRHRDATLRPRELAIRGPERHRFVGYLDEARISPTAWAGAAAVSLALWVSIAAAVSAYVA